MARVPSPGRVKTRLIPALGPDGAAELCRAMTEDLFAALHAWGRPWRVALAGDLTDPWVATIDALCEPQADGDLGARLRHALREGGIAIGTDAPTLPLSLLDDAAKGAEDIVFAPAFDGGYVLVGVADPAHAGQGGVFDDIPWSASDTLAASVLRARGFGLSTRLLPFWYDVDEPTDLAFLRTHLLTLPPSVAPRTRAFLQRLPPAPLLQELPHAAPNR